MGMDDVKSSPFHLAVYYGENGRWDLESLRRTEIAVANVDTDTQINDVPRNNMSGFDGLQADFYFDTKDEALAALLRVRHAGFRAESCGIGEGPTKKALDEAILVQKRI
jgi:hypothetical protein